MGRLELLSWLNKLLDADFSKIDHLGDGRAYLQVMDAIFPGKVPLASFAASTTASSARKEDREDRVKRLELLQRVMDACEVRKEVPIQKLANCRFADNCEFLQWIFDFLHRTYPDANLQYPKIAAKRREQGLRSKPGRRQKQGGSGRGPAGRARRRPPPVPASGRPQPGPAPSAAAEVGAATATATATAPLDSANEAQASGVLGAAAMNEALAPAAAAGGVREEVEAETLELDQLISLLEEQLTSRLLSQKILEEDISSARQDRDFYYEALRRVERALCLLPESERSSASSQTAADLLDILYQSEDIYKE